MPDLLLSAKHLLFAAKAHARTRRTATGRRARPRWPRSRSPSDESEAAPRLLPACSWDAAAGSNKWRASTKPGPAALQQPVCEPAQPIPAALSKRDKLVDAS